MRTNPRIVLLTTLVVLLVTISIPAWGNGPPACPKGSKIKVYPGGSIQSAVDAADPGDTVMVMPGVYHETVTISTDCLTLMGGWDGMDDADGWAALDGAWAGAGENGFEVLADHITIKGFEIRDYTGVHDPDSYLGTGNGVDGWNDGADYATVKGNFIHGMSLTGVYIGTDGSSVRTGWSIKDNVIEGAGFAAVRMTNCSDCEAKDNLLRSSRMCVLTTLYNETPDPISVSGVAIKDNEMVGCAQAATWTQLWQEPDTGDMYLSDVTIASNYIHDGGGGGIFFRDRNDETHLTGTRVTENVVVSQSRFGILLNRADEVMISGNWLENLGVRGIALIYDACRNVVTDNTVIGSGSDGIIMFRQSTSGLLAKDNVFRDNTVIDAGRYGLAITAGAESTTIVGNQVSGSASGCDLFWDESGPDNCWKENTGTQCPYPLPGC